MGSIKELESDNELESKSESELESDSQQFYVLNHRWLLFRWLLTDFKQVKKINSHFVNFEQVIILPTSNK